MHLISLKPFFFNDGGSIFHGTPDIVARCLFTCVCTKPPYPPHPTPLHRSLPPTPPSASFQPQAFCETLEESNYRLQKELLEKQKEIAALKKQLEEKEQAVLLLEKRIRWAEPSADHMSPEVVDS